MADEPVPRTAIIFPVHSTARCLRSTFKPLLIILAVYSQEFQLALCIKSPLKSCNPGILGPNLFNSLLRGKPLQQPTFPVVQKPGSVYKNMAPIPNLCSSNVDHNFVYRDQRTNFLFPQIRRLTNTLFFHPFCLEDTGVQGHKRQQVVFSCKSLKVLLNLRTRCVEARPSWVGLKWVGVDMCWSGGSISLKTFGLILLTCHMRSPDIGFRTCYG